MPRARGDGGGGGGGSAEKHQPAEQSGATGLGGWLGGAARAVTGSPAGNYVVLGGTRYGLRLSQDTQPPATSRDESSERRRSSKLCSVQPQSESRERLTDAACPSSPTSAVHKPSLDLTSGDCCCIGRSRLLNFGSRIPLSWSSSSCAAAVASTCPSRQHHHQNHNHHHPKQQQQPNSASNNSRACWSAHELLVANAASSNHGSATARGNVSLATTTTTTSSTSPSSQPVAEQPLLVKSSGGSSAVPKQFAHWPRHHSLRLQEPAVTAVDRLQRFRWSGGGGGGAGSKKSSSGGNSRSSDKAERLRELTEKLKGPAPVPPPRRPSRAQASSPTPQSSVDSSGHSLSPYQSQSTLFEPGSCDSRGNCRSYTFSEGSSSPGGAKLSSSGSLGQQSSGSSRPLGRSESVSDECSANQQQPNIGEARRTLACNNSASVNGGSAGASGVGGGGGGGVGRHCRQYSDSMVNIAKSCLGVRASSPPSELGSACDGNEARDALAGLLEPRASLFPGTRPVQPYRSASFGQADHHYGSSRQAASSQSVANARRAAYAASSDDKEARASTLPRVRRLEDPSRLDVNGEQQRRTPTPTDQSPRASTPSLADSAVGSSAEGPIGNQPTSPEVPSSSFDEEPARPRSDGSDSFATTSSTLASPEPTEQRQSGVVVVVVEDGGSVEVALGEEHVDRGPVATSPEQRRSATPVEQFARENIHRVPDYRIEPHEVIITPPQEDLQPNQQRHRSSRLSQTSEASEAPTEASTLGPATTTATAASTTPTGKLRRYRGDTSKRRKGVYITQWPETPEAPTAADSRGKLSGQSSEERDEPPPSATPSDLSDCEGQAPRRYSKRPLRGPYGQMLEAEMAKPRPSDIAHSLDEGLRQRRKVSANLSFNAASVASAEPATSPCHHRTTSSPSKLEGLPGPSPELLAELLRGSSERVARTPPHFNDTRTHVVVELYDTERSYVEALQILVNKYLQPLKSPENANLVDAAIVDEIFYQIPAILSHHKVFLEELRKRLDTWEIHQTIGDVFLEVFTKPVVLETYTLFLDNWKSAKKAIKATCQAKPAFARFLEAMEREHKGKLGLDQLLIKPVQKIPRYELLIQRLLKHTDHSHPDYQLLTAALKEVHELVVKINCTERESLEWEQQQTTLKEVQALVDGLGGIVTNDRTFIRHDLVSIASNQGTRKDRALFLFSDLLVITSIKRRSGTIRKPSTNTCPNSLVGILEANKYKLLMRIPLDDLEIMKAKDENLRRIASEMELLRQDIETLNELQNLASGLHGAKHQLEELIKEMLAQTQKQLAERNSAHSQLACLELTLNTQAGMENISVMFQKPDKRASWEESFNEAKQKLAASMDRKLVPEFVQPLPIRKTRAGLQFTCAAPTLADGRGERDVWVCNSDGYVGQVCVLNLTPVPGQVVSCNGVCNSRITCVTSIPACTSVSNFCKPINCAFVNNKSGVNVTVQNTDTSSGNIRLDSSSSDDSDSDDIPCADTASTSIAGDVSSLDSGAVEEDVNQPTMWLGTEDGCVHVYNCNDNIRIKKNKVRLQHGSSVQCIIYLDNKVFVSLANGDITVYSRDHLGGWITVDPTTLPVGTVASPVMKMLPVSGKLWCASHNNVKILNTYNLDIEHTFSVNSDNNRPITCMASSGGLGVWISLHNSAVLKLYNASNYECLTDVSIAPTVTTMLANCDDIIRQHKAACLRVTALLACNELLWIGTSAGVLLTVPIPHIKPSTQRMSQAPIVTAIHHGHTGQVRFLTSVETASPPKTEEPRPKVNRYSLKGSKSSTSQQSNNSPSRTGSTSSCGVEQDRILIISGGDGYEDFRGPPTATELQAGREDSTNHLLIWKV
ncbi:rho guanine nucleotide exchange factor 17 [Copidosoma floridanum]|uniref:rho guanine nucleotide exchange factor 17 n=1 Tax=Copidosoma floridanum TaxID=29053 RepID=UPI0006C981F9|nr:rho guanine nucleotide exchange factor 17 [Copidosoma floridanum]